MRLRTTSVLILASASIGIASLATSVAAQQGSSSDYQGVSRPPTDVINASPDPAPAPVIRKPSAGVLADNDSSQTTTSQNYATQSAQSNQSNSSAYVAQPSSTGPVVDPDSQPIAARSHDYAPPLRPELSTRQEIADPDSGIVQPRVARPGELLEGATIRVRLLDRLSSTDSERGQEFRGQVAYDVLQNGRVLIPAGSSIEGRVTAASSGHFGGHGSLRLRPDTVILPDGARFRMHAETTGTTGTHTRMGSEGAINPGSRLKKDGIEYGAVVGTGAVAGAVLGGPVGALTGSLVGAGIVTTHLMMDHPQATLEPGSILLFTLTEPMNLMAVN